MYSANKMQEYLFFHKVNTWCLNDTARAVVAQDSALTLFTLLFSLPGRYRTCMDQRFLGG